MNVFSSRLIIAATAAMFVGLSGCASVTPEQLDQAMEMARKAQSDAAAATQAASAAQRAADAAANTANAAQRAATAAGSAAQQANQCCTANTEKMDRMFREGMRK